MRIAALKIDGQSPDSAVLDQAARALLRGETVIAPTETRYGILARADRQETIERLYDLKKRDIGQATAVFVGDLREMAGLGRMTAPAEKLAKRFLPGPLTLVLQAIKDWPPPRVVDGKIGLRWSSAPTIQGLVERLRVPLTATSANISGRPDAECVEELAAAFGDRVALYLDAGPLAGAVSTVVDCAVEPVRILREGAISRTQIELALGRPHVG